MSKPKIDIRKLDQMLRAGKSQIEIAKYFSVTPGAVSQAKRQLNRIWI
jgi:DNA-binding CsgD family transcriptional regulator